MKIVTVFRKIEHTPSLDTKIKEKSLKLKKYLKGFSEIQWVCSVTDDGQHTSEVKLLHSSHEFYAKSKSDKLYKTFDMIIAKMEKQLIKNKDKSKPRLGQKTRKSYKKLDQEQRLKDEEWVQDKYEGKEVA